MLATYRSDSETVLAAAFPALERHLQDTDRTVRNNCVMALSGLAPSVPEGVVGALVKVLQAKRSDVTLIALRGVWRLYASNPIATNAIDDYLNGDDEKKLTLLASFGSGSHANPALITQLGRLLNDPSAKVVDAALQAIGENGVPAIRLLKPQLLDVAARTDNPKRAQTARDLLKALQPIPGEH